MTRIKALLCNRNFIFLFAIRVGLLFGYSAQWTRFSVLPGTLKNYRLAGGVVPSLFSKEAALPATDVYLYYLAKFQKEMDMICKLYKYMHSNSLQRYPYQQ